MYDLGLAILLLWHIGSIVVWLGGSLTFAFAFSPYLRVLPSEVRKSFFCSFFQRLSLLLGASSISAVVAGTILYGYINSVDTVRAPVGWGFIFLALGAVLGLVSLILTLGVVLPMGSKFISISNGNIMTETNRYSKEGTLDEESMLKVIGSTLATNAVILGAVLVMMILGTNL